MGACSPGVSSVASCAGIGPLLVISVTVVPTMNFILLDRLWSKKKFLLGWVGGGALEKVGK